jgi:hypothetical protein
MQGIRKEAAPKKETEAGTADPSAAGASRGGSASSRPSGKKG